MYIRIKNNSQQGFITLAPASIIAAILFVLTMQVNLDALVTIYQWNTHMGKVESNRVVDSCFANVQYKIIQKSLVANLSYTDQSGDYLCQGSVQGGETGQGNYTAILSSYIFGATSTHSGNIDQNNFIKNEEKI